MNRIALAASLLAALLAAGCTTGAGQSVFGDEPNPYACSSDSAGWLAQRNLCRDTPSM